MNKTKKTILKKLTLALMSFVFTLLLLEIGIRFYGATTRKGFSIANKKSIPFRNFGHNLYSYEKNKKYILSRHGEKYPFLKDQNTYRIVTLGGSTTENMIAFRKHKIHYPFILQERLKKSLGTKNVEVINVGYSGYSTAHSLILFQLHVINWQPDLIIVSHNINDLLASYWPKFEIDYSHKYQHSFYNPPVPTLLERSQLYQKIKSEKKPIFPIMRKSYGDTLPLLSAQVFSRNLTHIITLAKKNDIKIILGSQPCQQSEEYFTKHIQYKPYNSIVTYPLHSEFIEHHKQFNQIIENIADKEQIFFVDNASIFAGQQEYFFDVVHYSKRGVRKLAISYSEYILKNNLILK